MKSKEIRIARKAAKAEARQSEAAAKAKQNEDLILAKTTENFPIPKINPDDLPFSKIHPDGRIEPSFVVGDDGKSYMHFTFPVEREWPDDGKLEIVETKEENGQVTTEFKLPGNCVISGFGSEEEVEEDGEEENLTEAFHAKSRELFEVLATMYEAYETLCRTKKMCLKAVAQTDEQQEALDSCLDWQSLQICQELTKEQKLEFTHIQEKIDDAERCMQKFAEEHYVVLNFVLDQFSLQPRVNLMNHNESLDSHMHQMNFYWTAESKCKHIDTGISSTPLSTVKFLESFTDKYNASVGVLGSKLQTVYVNTMVEHSHIWKDQKKIEWIASHFWAMGTQCILEENIKAAGRYASLAYFFEQHRHNTKNLGSAPSCVTINWPKINELGMLQDEHTLVSFFRKRIHCSCLKKKYDEVKYIPKIGICLNFGDCYGGNCGKVERNNMLCCSRCRRANYCCRKCQVADWPNHKTICKLHHQLGILGNYKCYFMSNGSVK